MLIFAHRGYHEAAPENTMDAFAAAVALGVDGIETDVRLSFEGELLLFHDRALRCGIPVASLSRAQLSARCGHPVATLNEALSTFPELHWNLEIKTPLAMPGVLKLLGNSAPRGGVTLSSFHHPLMLATAARSHWPCALLQAHDPLSLDELLACMQPHPNLRTLVWDCETISAAAVRQAQQQDVASWAFSPHTAEEHRAMCQMGLAALITDTPQACSGHSTPSTESPA